ncbi:flagellar protein FlaG [Alteromonas lipotrueiana]|uniref:flagellar protein FlaG n=1 Tax=Alteromonas lipotrueiana TaxID=2803815 RepID=UPI001C46D601|nr:flagellar protein FlaG [Alteromonas lipotrueiana]
MNSISVQTGQSFAFNGLSSETNNEAKPAKPEAALAADNSNTQTQNTTDQKAAQNVQVSAELADKELSEKQDANIDVALQEVEDFLQVQNRNLAFSVDDETKRAVVTVTDSQSGDVIRQIPSEEVLQLAERIKDLQQDIGNRVGVLINNQV